ncbi:hypothetical protein CRG98_025051 [Punica granatum]|nr:hypothetical protein CRG98_025051 [Punica granatum]
MASSRRSFKRMKISACPETADLSPKDQLSRLPDGILLDILDRLPLREAIATSFIARRWRYLWRFMGKVDFTYHWLEETGKEIIPSVNSFIWRYKGKKIEHFGISFRYSRSKKHQVRSWVYFALRNKVEELDLNFNDLEDQRKTRKWKYHLFQLPKGLFCSSSLSKLSLSFLRLELPPRIQLKNLKELYFDRVILQDDAVSKITALCPVLELLSLFNCNMDCSLVVKVPPRPARLKLIILDEFLMVDYKKDLVIDAPGLSAIELCSGLTRKRFFIDNLPDGVEARLNFDDMLYGGRVILVNRPGLRGRQQYSKSLLFFLYKFRATCHLHLCSWCIQLLAVQKLMGLEERLSFDSTTLTLDTGLLMWELPGIAYLLDSCPVLEKLKINMVGQALLKYNDSFKRCHNFVEEGYWVGQGMENLAGLRNLRVVEFNNTHGAYQTWDDGSFNLRGFFTSYVNGVHLLRFLERKAPKLEKVIFRTNKKQVQVEKDALSVPQV